MQEQGIVTRILSCMPIGCASIQLTRQPINDRKKEKSKSDFRLDPPHKQRLWLIHAEEDLRIRFFLHPNIPCPFETYPCCALAK